MGRPPTREGLDSCTISLTQVLPYGNHFRAATGTDSWLSPPLAHGTVGLMELGLLSFFNLDSP
jgi:hypothetical protein